MKCPQQKTSSDNEITGKNEMLILSDDLKFSDNDMLLLEPIYTTIPSTSESSVALLDIPTAFPNCCQNQDPLKENKRKIPEPDLSKFEAAPFKMIEMAFQLVIGGYSRQINRYGCIRAEKPFPETLLSSIVPSLFCPDFRKVFTSLTS
jgi:hypothetical protein